MPLVTSGVEYGNLRELVLARMRDLGTKCRDVRTLEDVLLRRSKQELSEMLQRVVVVCDDDLVSPLELIVLDWVIIIVDIR